MQMRSPFDGRYHNTRKSGHVIILGVLKYSVVKEVCREFFHSDLYTQAKIVILSSEKPSAELKQLLNIPYYRSRVVYLRGSELVKADLERADLLHAAAVFILSNRYEENANQSDSETVVRCLAIRSFCPDIKIFVHMIKTENKENARQAGVFRVMCLEEMTMVRILITTT